MKTKNYLCVASLAGILALAGCKTTSHTDSPPPDTTAPPPPVAKETSAYLIDLVKTAPHMVSVGEEFSFQIKVTAKHDVGDVMVMDMVPAGSSYVGSAPEGTHESGKLTWALGNMNAGETKSIKVTLKAEKQGELVNCATASAVPRVCTVTVVGKPQLAVKKTGPETAMVGQAVAYNIMVQNTGNSVARNVVATDTVPDGMAAAGGQKELTFEIGDLAAGASKSIPVTLTAQKRGKVCNKVAVSSSNAGKLTAESCTTIVSAGVKITKSTNDKETFINRAVAYEIVVSNTGDTDLAGVVVTDNCAPETVIATADNATVTGKTATWNVGTLKAGEKKTFTVKVVSKVPGEYCDTATVTTAQGLTDSAKSCTFWKGVTGVLVEMMDDPDPIQVGETSKYTIKVTNQGSTIDISQLNISITLPAELDVVASTISDGGRVDGKTITWPAVPSVAPKAAVIRTYVAKGVKAGDARTKIAVTTSMRKEPIEQFESTTVY